MLFVGFINPFSFKSWMSAVAYISASFPPLGTAGSQWVYAAIGIEHLQQFLGPSLLQCCSPLGEHKNLLFASEIRLGCPASSVCCLEMPCQGLHTVFHYF